MRGGFWTVKLGKRNLPNPSSPWDPMPNKQKILYRFPRQTHVWFAHLPQNRQRKIHSKYLAETTYHKNSGDYCVLMPTVNSVRAGQAAAFAQSAGQLSLP